MPDLDNHKSTKTAVSLNCNFPTRFLTIVFT